MSDAPHAPPALSPMRRRLRYALRAAALLLAITAVCLFAGLLASRVHARLDVTATREHRLSQRTLALLDRLDRPHEIVLAGNFRALDSVSRQRSDDVLAALAAASPHIRVTRIDTAAAQGLEKYDALMDRCAEEFGSALREAAAHVAGVAEGAESLAPGLEALAQDIEAVRRGTTTTDPSLILEDRYLEGRAAMARVKAEDLRAAATAARQALGRSIGRAPIPPVDESARALRPQLSAAADEVADLHNELRALAARQDRPEALRRALEPVLARAVALRDGAARAVALLDSLRTPPILAAARAMERAGGAIVLAEPRPGDADSASRARARGLTAIDFAVLFPPAQAAGSGGVKPDQRFRAEELLATAIGALNNPDAPILCIVHGAPETISPDRDPIRALRDRLALRGVDIAEWPAALSPEPPAFTTLDPAGRRPVVYAVIPTAAGSPEGAVRMAKLADVIARLVADGKPVLVSVVPSTLPSIGEPDPMVAFLAPLGAPQADSARALMQQYRTPRGSAVTPDLLLPDPGIPASADRHPIAATLAGLPTFFPWPVPIRTTATPEGSPPTVITPLIRVPADPGIWAESEWLRFRQIDPASRPLVRDPPGPDSARDDTKGPWTIAAAVERRLPGRTAPHRLIIVGSNGWFFDAVAAETVGTVDGRTALAAPGNVELLEASISWLAGQDELIAPSPAAHAVPLVPPIAAGSLVLVRWLLVLGLPTLVLAAGVAWRMLRG